MKISKLKTPQLPFWEIPNEEYDIDNIRRLIDVLKVQIKKIIPPKELKDIADTIVRLFHVMTVLGIAESIKKGKEIPPVTISKSNELLDGLHRFMGHVIAGKDDMPCRVGLREFPTDIAPRGDFIEFMNEYNRIDKFQKMNMPYELGTTRGRDDIREFMSEIPLHDSYWMDKTVLDIGCDCGAWSLEVLHRGAEKVTGVDKNPVGLAFADKLRFLFKYQDKLALISEEFSNLDWEQIDACDVVFVNQVLYRFKEGAKALDIITSKCKEYVIMLTFTKETVDTTEAPDVYWIPPMQELEDKMKIQGFTLTFLGDTKPSGKRLFVFKRDKAYETSDTIH